MKAVIQVGGKQYIVTEKETLLVDRLQDGTKELSLEPLMIIDGDTTKIGTPAVSGVTVKATVEEPEIKGDKIKVVRFESKKRVKTINGHRQQYSRIKIDSIG
ncbi:MAG TPA: 50S ribosomal protein L21 [Candidatus Saccharimonadales bacterium]|nr:50S ribosomal protein L21 [Candidatus Saccharimonadales bacterium]